MEGSGVSLTYLASPYSHADADVRQRRFEQVCAVASQLMERGEALFCPIAHSHSIHMRRALPETFEFWMAMDLPVLQHCSRVKVLMLDGWQASKGVAREVAAAEAMGIPVEFIEYHAPRAHQETSFVDDE